MPYNTGNPVGSSDPRDAFDNFHNLDDATNGDAYVWTDRFGRQRKSWAAIVNDFDGPYQQAIAAAESADEDAQISSVARDQAVAASEASGLARLFDTYANAESATDLSEGDIVEVVSDETRGGMVSRYRYESGNLVFKYQPAQRYVTADGATQARTTDSHFSDFINVRDFASVQQAVDYAVDASRSTVTFPAASYDCDGVDFKGVSLQGLPLAEVTGTFINHGELNNISIEGYISSESPKNISLAGLKSSGVITVKDEDNGTDVEQYSVYSKNADRGEFTRILMRKSPGLDTGPWALIRQQQVYSVIKCCAFQKVTFGSGRVSFGNQSNWSEYTLTNDDFGDIDNSMTSSSNSHYPVAIRTSVTNAYVDIDVYSKTGVSNIAFVSIQNDAKVNISVDGQSQYTSLLVGYDDATSGSIYRGIIQVPIRVKIGAKSVVRVTSTTSANMRILGVNMFTPGDGKGHDDFSLDQAFYDSYLAIQRISTYDYVKDGGASDYAFEAVDDQFSGGRQFVGSYHGLEEEKDSNSVRFIMDGKVGSRNRFQSIGVPRVGTSITFEQRTIIMDTLETLSLQTIGDSYIEKDVKLSGSLRSDIQYLGMCMPSTSYSELMYPTGLFLDYPDGERIGLGNTDGAIFYNSSTRQKIVIKNTAFTKRANNRGGCAHIKITYGSYYKLYNSFDNGYESEFSGNKAFQHIQYFG